MAILTRKLAPEKKTTQDKNSRLSYLERLHKITHLIHSSENLDDILINLKNSILPFLNSDLINIYAVDKVSWELFTKFLNGKKENEIRLPITKKSIIGYAASTGNPILINDAYDESELKAIHPELEFDKTWDKKHNYHTKQILAEPLIHEKCIVGVLQVINKKTGNFFQREDESMAQEIARVLALALYNLNKQFSRQVAYKSKFDYLLREKIISKNNLQNATIQAKKQKIDVASILMESHRINKDLIGKSLSVYYNLKFIGYDANYVPSPYLLDRISKKDPIKFLKFNCWVPYKELENGRLIIICENPNDQSKISDIGRLIKSEYELAVGLREDILTIINRLSGSDSAAVDLGDIDQTLADISIDEVEVVEDKSRTTISENDVGIVKLVNQIIIDASGKGCSDIHIETYSGEHNTIIRFRSDGVCFLYKEIPFSWKRALIARIKIISNLDIAERRLPQDGKIRIKYGNNHIDLRVATIPTCDGNEDAVLRILHSADPLTFEELNLSPRNMKVLSEVVNRRIGIYLVAGPTGSGKTTTLHSVLKKMNTIDRKIWTAEDPIEISQEGLRQVQMHPSIGLTFAHALRSFLRADPDIIMIGEMRDQETAKMGIEASLTGHLVLSTLHTNSAPETVVRLVEMGVDPFLFADGLIGVLAQRLARTLCKNCKEKYTPSKKELEALAEDYGKDYWPELKATQDSVTMFKPKGCENCNNTGFRGRIGLHEILDVNEETKHLIAKSAGADDIRKAAIKNGMRTLRQDGIWKIIKGHINFDLLKACVD